MKSRDLRGFWKDQELPLVVHKHHKIHRRRDYRDKSPGMSYPNESITHLYRGDIPVWELEGEYRDFTEIEKVELDQCYSIGE